MLLPAAFAYAQEVSFSTYLKRGSSGQDVSRLQEFLKTIPGVYPEGMVTGYFWALTERAVQRFQAKYGIEQVGVVGPKTRGKLNSLISLGTSRKRQSLRPQQLQQGTSLQQSIRTNPEQNGTQKPQTAISAASQFAALEKELIGVKTSGSYLAPAHYDRILEDLAALERKGYLTGEIGRLRALAQDLAPHVKDQQKSAAGPLLQPIPSMSPQDTVGKESNMPVLKNLGVRFEPWDKDTNRAGAFVFVSSEDKLFFEYGAEVGSAEGGTKILPTFEYRVVSDADVFAAMDGVITNIMYQEKTQDYAVHIQPELNSQWTLEHDHVSNLKISKGDIVKAGDMLGRVGNFGGGLGRTEIMLWNASGSRPTTYCPLKYFDPQLVSEYQEKVLRHIKDWEEFKDNLNIYGEEKHIVPGCAYETLLD